jgi:hypothetical protein
MNLIQSERQRGLQGLVATGDVKMNWSPDVMERRAPFGIKPVAENRIRGMLLGLAIGEAASRNRPSCRARPCARCRRLLDAHQLKFTSRHKVTNGVECNWKKLKAKPVSSSGAFKFVSF